MLLSRPPDLGLQNVLVSFVRRVVTLVVVVHRRSIVLSETANGYRLCTISCSRLWCGCMHGGYRLSPPGSRDVVCVLSGVVCARERRRLSPPGRRDGVWDLCDNMRLCGLGEMRPDFPDQRSPRSSPKGPGPPCTDGSGGLLSILP